MEGLRCVLYVRVSDQSQVDGTSLDTQEKLCREYAERQGFKVVRTFREEGVSAKTLNRPEFQKLLDYVATGKAKAVILYKMDRLSRNLYNQLLAIQDLERSGASLHSATENVSDTPAGKLQRNILGSFAEYDNAIRAERSRGGLVARFIEGYWVSAPPPGYTMTRDPITKRSKPVRNDMSSIIAWAFEQRAKGWTLKRIAEGMNARGYHSRYGKKIREQNLDRILKNKFYMGIMNSFGKQIEGKYEPVVSPDIWYRCQAVNEENAHASPTRNILNPLFPLRGFITCSHCGERLTASAPKGRTKQYKYYHHHSSSQCPFAENIAKEKLEADFKSHLAKLKPKPGWFKLVKAVLLDVWERKITSHHKEQVSVGRKLEGLELEKANLLQEKRRAPHLYTDQDFMDQVAELNNKIKAIEELRSEATTERNDFEEVVTIAFNALKDPLKSWEELTDVRDKARFNAILFPEGLSYNGQSLLNPKISLLMSLFEAASQETGNTKEAIYQSVRGVGVEPTFADLQSAA